jgi:hypothetical protein
MARPSSQAHVSKVRSTMRGRVMAVAVLLVGACLPAAAQAPRAARVVLASTAPREFSATVLRASHAHVSSSATERPLAHSALPLAPAYKNGPSFANRLPIENFRSPLVTESTVPLVHLWRGLKLDAFQTTMYSESLQRGSPESGVTFQSLRPLGKDQASLADSFQGSGISLRYTFGESAASRPVEMWRFVSSMAR